MNAPPRSHFVSRVGLALAVAAALTLGGLWLMRGRAADAADESKGREQGDSEPIAVKVLRPRKDPTFRLGVEQPAYVTAYYTADLKARVAGPVKAVYCDIGSRVKANDTLLKVDVPDLEEDVLQKQALIEQRTRELELARTNIATASAAADAAQAAVKVKQSDVESTAATRRFREKEMKRFKALVEGKDPGVTPDVYDERVQFYESAVAAESAARAAVIKAQADFTEAQAKVEAAKADVTLKDSLVAVARKDKDLAAALLSYATLKAPFDGVITQRGVDPGSFVQNAASGQTMPLLTLDRIDLVTVYMKVPDNYAAYMTPEVEAVIEMKAWPRVRIHSQVTRYSDTLVNPDHDRTMRVEVDLYNDTPAAYQEFASRERTIGFGDLKDHKLPPLPRIEGAAPAGKSLRLVPGMYGSMRLLLRDLGDSLLLPSTSVFSQGGRSFLFLVKDGKVVRTPVEVQVDDGRLVKLTLVETVGGRETKRSLTADDVVVASNQGELSDGQAVKTTATDW